MSLITQLHAMIGTNAEWLHEKKTVSPSLKLGDTQQTLRVRTLVSSGCDVIHTAPTVDRGLEMNQQRMEYLPAGSEGKATDLSFFSSAAERQFFTVFSSWSSHLSVPHWGMLQWMMKRAAIPLAWLTATAKGKVKKLVQLICFIFFKLKSKTIHFSIWPWIR